MSFTDPYRVHADFGNGPEPALLLGWYPDVKGVADGLGLISRQDGSIEMLAKEWITLDWRYDAPTDKWVSLEDWVEPGAEPEGDEPDPDV